MVYRQPAQEMNGRSRNLVTLFTTMSSLEQTVGIFTTDTSLVIRSWDAWLSTYSGISPEQARGELLFALFPELEERGFVSRFERVLNEGIIEVLAPRFHHFLIPCRP